MNSFSHKIWKERYAEYNETQWVDTAERCSRVAGAAEKEDIRKGWERAFFEQMACFNFIPGGRILRNAGKSKQFMMNCIVLDLDDSRESIGQLLKDTLIVSGTGGGVGVSFSNLRPRGEKIVTCGGESSGPVSFMRCLNEVAKTIESGGGRRAALMISLSVYHPDIMEFLHEKLDLKSLTYANISVEIDNKFIEAVKNGETWATKWAGSVHSTIPARDIWQKIITNAYNCGEPGILNMSNIKLYSNSEYFNPIFSTNPCGEQPLPPYGCCCLGSINMANFVKGKNLDIKGFKKAIEVGVRFLDDIITVNDYPLELLKFNATSGRRIGLGLTGLHYAMLKLGIRYSSQKGLDFTEKVYEILRNQSYLVSTQLAKEKGAFNKFLLEPYINNKFIKTLPYSIRSKIREHGIRNVCLNTQAPTGTTSIIAGVSSGIEPIPAPIYERKYFSDTKTAVEVVSDPLYKEMFDEGKDVSHFEGAHDIPVEAHLAIQEAAQRYIDASISKTINIPKHFSLDKVSSLLLQCISGLKGVTLYREGSRGEEPIKPIKQVTPSKKAELSITNCSIGGCEI